MNAVLDTYTVRARLWPALLVALPLGLATLALLPEGIQSWSALWSLFVFSGGTALFAEIGRDFGKKKEAKLFELWGGKPTTRMLRHSDVPNEVVLARRHRQLQGMMPGLNLPTPEGEKKDPLKADQIYDNCVEFLRTQTRDRKRFPLVFEENCNYGFRRNLWGMKTLGILTTSIGTIAIGVAMCLNFLGKGIFPSPLIIVCGLGNLLLLLGWFIWFTPKWVKIPADAYGQRLLESIDAISAP